MFIFRGAHVGQQHLLWRFVHHLPNYARESRITSWWPFKHAASITESLLRTDFFCKAYWPTPFNMHFDFRPLFRITFAELSRKYPHSQTPTISRGCTEGKAKTRGLGVWLSQTLTFGNLVTATRILWCPSPAGPRAAVAGTFAKLSRNKLLLSRTRKKLSRGFPTEHAWLSQLKLLTRTFRSITNFEVAIPIPKPASRRLRFSKLRYRSFPIPPTKPATQRLRFKSRLRFQSQNLHPTDCDSIRNLHSAGCDSIRNLQVATPVPKPASRRLRFNSQPALRRLRLNSQPASCDSSPKTCIPQVAIQFATCTPQVATWVATCKLRFQSQNLHPASCDSSPKTCIPQVAIQFATCTPQVATQFATCKLRFQSQNLHPAGCDSIRNLHSAGCDSIRNLQVAIPVPKPAPRRLRFNSQPALRRLRLNSQPASCDSSPKTCIPQVAIPVPKPASRRLRFNSQPALRRLRLNSQPASCDSSPKTCIPQVAIQFATYTPQVATQFATCKLRFQSQNLHPADCDSIRNLHSAGCDSIRNLQVAIPVPKPASRRLRFNSQPALRRLRLNSQPASWDSSPKTCIPQVAIQFATCTPQVATQFATCKLRFQSQNLHRAGCESSRRLRFNSQPALRRLRLNSQPASCDSSPKTCIPQVAIQFATCTPQVATQFATCKLRFQSQNLHPAGCDSNRNLQVAIPVPKPASRRLRFNSQPALRRLRLNSQPASCDSSPKILHPAGCDSIRNLHSAGCDSIRNLQVAIPVPKACNLQAAIHFEVAIPVPKPASRRLRLNSQPARCDSNPS